MSLRAALWSMLTLGALTPGCAAMVRAWEFSAAPVTDAGLDLSLWRATVKQDVARVELALTNAGQAPVTLRIDAVELRADDAPILLSGGDPLRLDSIGQRLDPRVRAAPMSLAPGQQAPIERVFHVVGHDLRRHPSYTVAVYVVELTSAGEAGRWISLQVRAPAEAPVGERI